MIITGKEIRRTKYQARIYCAEEKHIQSLSQNVIEEGI
jgi:hypothetical protein